MNSEFEAFKLQEEKYKLTVLYLLKNVNQDIKEKILNLVDINFGWYEEELDYFGEIISGEYDFSQGYYDLFYIPEWNHYPMN